MEDFVHQARVTLTTYLERGEVALLRYGEGDVDGASEMLLWRKAAFHNFRVIEANATRAGVDLAADEELRDFARAIEQLDRELAQAIDHVKAELKTELAMTKANREKLSKFISGPRGSTGFQGAV